MIGLLKSLIEKKGEDKSNLIKEFQSHVWDDHNLPEFEDQKQVLRDLAYDLDFADSEEKRDLLIRATLEILEAGVGDASK